MNAGDEDSTYLLHLRKSLRKELASRAVEFGMTMRAFIMFALKAQGLDVREDEIVERRGAWREETLTAAQ